MQSVIINENIEKKDINALPGFLYDLLPGVLSEEIRGSGEEVIEEIRLRSGRCAMLTTTTGNVVLDTVVSAEELGATLRRMCDGSLYAHSETINQGYISLQGGVRVGVCGRAAVCEGMIIGVYDVSSLCVRIPHKTDVDAGEICDLLMRGKKSGVLVYSLPGVGKTTLLRAVAERMSFGRNALRVCVVDSRGEIAFGLDGKKNSLDVLSGYPKGIGIEIAVRTLGAELVVCDEIGSEDDVVAILSVQNSGVPILASAHASSVGEMLCRSGMRRLHDSRAFGTYVGLSRTGNKFSYDICSWERACDIS